MGANLFTYLAARCAGAHTINVDDAEGEIKTRALTNPKWIVENLPAAYAFILHGKVDLLKAAIAVGFDVNEATVEFGSPLLFAIRSAETEAVKLLLDSGAELNLGKFTQLKQAYLCEHMARTFSADYWTQEKLDLTVGPREACCNEFCPSYSESLSQGAAGTASDLATVTAIRALFHEVYPTNPLKGLPTADMESMVAVLTAAGVSETDIQTMSENPKVNPEYRLAPWDRHQYLDCESECRMDVPLAEQTEVFLTPIADVTVINLMYQNRAYAHVDAPFASHMLKSQVPLSYYAIHHNLADIFNASCKTLDHPLLGSAKQWLPSDPHTEIANAVNAADVEVEKREETIKALLDNPVYYHLNEGNEKKDEFEKTSVENGSLILLVDRGDEQCLQYYEPEKWVKPYLFADAAGLTDPIAARGSRITPPVSMFDSQENATSVHKDKLMLLLRGEPVFLEVFPKEGQDPSTPLKNRLFSYEGPGLEEDKETIRSSEGYRKNVTEVLNSKYENYTYCGEVVVGKDGPMIYTLVCEKTALSATISRTVPKAFGNTDYFPGHEFKKGGFGFGF